MKFSLKLLLWTIIVTAAALGFSGYYLVNFVFDTALAREVQQALDENSILRFAFETAALNAPAKYDVLPDSTVEQIASSLESGGLSANRQLRLSDENKRVLFASEGFDADNDLLLQTDEFTKTYKIIRRGSAYFIQTGIAVSTLNRNLYLETRKDVSAVFNERELGFSVYRRVTMILLVCGIFVMHFIAAFLTKPIRLLTKATKRMAVGDYAYRAKQISDDELGQLTMDFNRMAASLEENVGELEAEIRSREDFVAAFAHELKTPLTSIIGYADVLRSRKLDEEKSFLSANYIYTEGKRLEAMSLRLLDIIVTKRQDIALQRVSAEALCRYLHDMFDRQDQMRFAFNFEKGFFMAEADLIKTVLVNLVDNACKASEPGGKIEITGSCVRNVQRKSGKTDRAEPITKAEPSTETETAERTQGYRFEVRDYGVGIPEEELKHITKAFYMVDKSRSRSHNGAGLGLALCEEILLLHGSTLVIESKPGEGTCVSFVLASEKEGGLQ